MLRELDLRYHVTALMTSSLQGNRTAKPGPLPLSGHDLAPQTTLSRLENRVTAKELIRSSWALFALSLQAHPKKRKVIFDLDLIDDPIHGSQLLSLFHG